VLVNIKSVSEHLMLLTSSLGVNSSRFITKLNSLQLVIWLYISEESSFHQAISVPTYITSRAFEFIHDGALIRFWCWVFKCDETISISSFPVDDKFARGFQMKMKIIRIILEKCPYWRDVHIKDVYLLNFPYIARALRIVLSRCLF
jgi:hypothetical protein